MVLVPHRHHLNGKARFHIDDWLCAKVREDALCQEALSTQVWEKFMVEALLDDGWFNHSHFEMKLLAFSPLEVSKPEDIVICNTVSTIVLN